MTFGLTFILVLAASIVYAIGRTVYERIRPPQLVDHGPAVIPWSSAVRAANRIARDRMAAECNTVRLVPAVAAGGQAVLEDRRDPGAQTVDLGDRFNSQFGRHRRGAGVS